MQGLTPYLNLLRLFDKFKHVGKLLVLQLVNCLVCKSLVLNRIMCFGQNTYALTDALVLKWKILYLFELVQMVYINRINIEDNSH